MKMDYEYWLNLSMVLFLIVIMGLMVNDYMEFLK